MNVSVSVSVVRPPELGRHENREHHRALRYRLEAQYAKNCFEEFPDAKRYWDWRKMFDELGDQIDGVMVATRDHTHATIAATALTMGKLRAVPKAAYLHSV